MKETEDKEGLFGNVIMIVLKTLVNTSKTNYSNIKQTNTNAAVCAKNGRFNGENWLTAQIVGYS